jgi:hypothetical protein
LCNFSAYSNALETNLPRPPALACAPSGRRKEPALSMIGSFAIERGRKEMKRPKLPTARFSAYRDLIDLWPFWVVFIAVAVAAPFLSDLFGL